jgi:hypothetical protein
MDVRRTVNDNNVPEPQPVRPAVSSRHVSDGATMRKVVMGLVGLVALGVLIWLGARAYGTLTADSAVKSKQFQAVFLTNGQVYFGKFSQINSSYVKLTDIYYLQVQQTVQPSSSSSSSSNNQQVSLAKLGGELHGPEDVMFINRDQVLFWENLKNSGKVVQAIQKYQASGSSN